MLENIICNSGEAQGSDLYWGKKAKERGIKVINWTPKNLSKKDLDEGKEMILKANKVLKRPVDKYLTFLARNWCQVKYSDIVLAIGYIINPGEISKKGFKNILDIPIVDGGTSWAIQMAIDCKKQVYLFEQNEGLWKKWYDNIWINCEPPKITCNFAGIGTRFLTDKGMEAIDEVFKV